MKRIAAIALLALTVATGSALIVSAVTCRVERDIVYNPRNGEFDTLDLYLHDGAIPRPTLVYFHGGGWRPGVDKESVKIWRSPFLFLGWNVANVEYRRSNVALAPAAVEDCLCAVRWVRGHAAQYHFDTSRLVLMGDSAGGLLALTTGVISGGIGLDDDCPEETVPPVAAIIEWAGVTDLSKLLSGADERSYATSWIGGSEDGAEIAREVSPITYIRAGLPPIFMIHANHDTVVPYSQASRFHDALDAYKDRNILITIPGIHHTDAGLGATIYAYALMLKFLSDNEIRLFP